MNNPENGVSSWPILATSTTTKTLNSLYDDVLTCILLFCSDSYVNDSLDSERYPWVLTHVCRRWRTLVLASPHFWSTIYLVFENYLDLRPTDVVLRAKTFLQKSGNVTDLIVHIEEHLNGEVEDYEERREPFVQSLIALLIPTTSRWLSVEISAFPDLYGMLSGCSFERLRTLELSPLPMDDDSLGVGDHITLFRDAVRLNELKLDGPWRGTIIIPCGGIKWFDTSSYGLRILPQMHDLRTLRIEDDACVIEVLDQILSELGSFVLPSLRDFIFCESTSNRFLYELSKLMRAPALERLEIVDTFQHVSRPRGPTHFPVFTDLDNLIRLVICFEPEEENDLTDFLSRVPSVTTLHLCQNVATPATLRAIQLGVLPKLTTLSLSFRTMQMHAKSVISMLHARAQNSVGGPIGMVRFVRCTHNMYDLANDGWDEWKSNEALGLEETLRTKWLELRERIDVHFDHQVDF